MKRDIDEGEAADSQRPSFRYDTGRKRGSRQTEEAALKLLYMALRNVAKKWSQVQGWREALNRFQLLWPDRMPELERV